MLELLPLFAFLLIAFSIGSNDTSNAFGICIGCRIISVRKAAILLFFLVLIGLNLQGSRVMKTVGENLVETNVAISAMALMISALIVVFTNIRGIPVSTHQVIVGSLSGAGIAFGTQLSFKTLAEIVISWILSPLLAGILAILLLISIERVSRKFGVLEFEKFLRILLLCSGMLIAYNMGANELATAIAPFMATKKDLNLISVLGAVSISLGALALSRRISETLCRGITSIDPKTGFSAHFGAGICVYIFTLFGMPVSTTYALIGGISSVGLVKSARTVNFKKIQEVVANWVFAPLIAFSLAFTASKVYFGI
uniref:Inorganic phosphate transporter n=1 Tax=Archaeoglobus fulgidus TaxID=2234 RepID=A0A7C3MCG8_ARCFL